MSKNMKKKRKHVVFPFVLCLLIAIAVWLYASAKSEDEREEADVNKEIAAVEDLNENYQIGAAYFLKLRTLTFDQLWTDYLQPLLQEYVQGMYDEDSIMNRFAKAYGYKKPTEGDVNEITEN